LSVSFEGHWRALTLWGVLPADGPVSGRVTYMQDGSATRMHFAYTTSAGVLQEQWAVWERGGEHVTIASNSTWLQMDDGEGPVLASACALIERGRATEKNDPAFCSRTREVQFRFDGMVGDGGSGAVVERWVYDRIARAPNATLTLLLQRPGE